MIATEKNYTGALGKDALVGLPVTVKEIVEVERGVYDLTCEHKRGDDCLVVHKRHVPKYGMVITEGSRIDITFHARVVGYLFGTNVYIIAYQDQEIDIATSRVLAVS
ncbi:hypothetical protein [Bacillus thuringiensis]|uniref:hypothetical protein n=1 Tax=Bacillus thuringiensis TaxID=1428 RepID=UPI000BFBA730|nr:hypothetical protein [Bacillus thuringiensis]PGT89979.1 hypothetical protein COD17_09525 [Bacillus thuringiensis]